MNRSRTVILFTAMSAGILATSHSALRAQIPGGPQVISPEVLPDRRVAFRIWAPKAEEVILRGDWMEGTTVERLSRNDEGVWTATVGPLRPDYYSYSLWVDGVRTLDPQNPEVKQGVRSVENMFFLPGEEAEFQAVAPVPHGQVRRIWYSSSTLGTVRRMHVYTPPDYDGTTTSYPVLYLLHGGGDDDSGWSTIGRAGFILDNLLAAGKAQPLLIVMPNGSIPLPAGLPRAAPGETPSEEVRRALAETQKKFVHELMHDVIPYVEAHFRVVDNPSHRALAGLSMGGGQT
ncbi:MAG TPA: alpha/beta hydrolase-fold protein, partial [Acidobacteriota bacterium]|nr:alpha/beta hydrolase-fold protein [Acidobacteriota bacterium]